MMRHRHLTLCATLLLAACGSSPKTQFYTLTPAGAVPMSAVPAGYFAAVLPVQVPEALDRPQLVIYDAGNQVQVLEQSRWAGSLKDEIRLALVNTLQRRGISNIHGAPVPENRPTYRITLAVNILRVAAQPPAQWQATWSLRSVDGKRSAVCTASGSDTAGEAVESYRAAVAALSARVADSLQQLAAGGRAAGCVVG